MIAEEKVTSAALREMPIGQSRTFQMPRNEPHLSRAVNSGKAIAYRLQRELCCTFTAATDYDNATLTITKLAKL